MIEVVAGLIKIDGLYLIARRTDGDIGAIHRFEFPGGKVLENENYEDALIREIKEELNINIKVIKYLCDYKQVYATRTIYLRLYLCESNDKIISMNACHDEYKLINFKDIGKNDLAVADRALYDLIKDDDL